MSEQMVKPGSDLLIPQALVVQPKFGNDAMHERMSGPGFLPRLQLMTSTSRIVQNDKSKVGNYVLVKGKETVAHDFGNSFSALVINWRPKAVDFTNLSKVKAYYNPAKEGFKHVEVEADKPQQTRTKGYVYGPEYLIYLPLVDQIACFHFNNITMRMRAAEMKALLGKAGSFRSEIIEKNGNRWPGPIISVCSTPLAIPAIGTPEGDDFFARLNEQVTKFANPPDEEVEEVEEDAKEAVGGGDRAR